MGSFAGGRRRGAPAHEARTGEGAFEQDHDLPLLAREEGPNPPLDWEPLLADGIQPALALGAERRRHGRR